MEQISIYLLHIWVYIFHTYLYAFACMKEDEDLGFIRGCIRIKLQCSQLSQESLKATLSLLSMPAVQHLQPNLAKLGL